MIGTTPITSLKRASLCTPDWWSPIDILDLIWAVHPSRSNGSDLSRSTLLSPPIYSPLSISSCDPTVDAWLLHHQSEVLNGATLRLPRSRSPNSILTVHFFWDRRPTLHLAPVHFSSSEPPLISLLNRPSPSPGPPISKLISNLCRAFPFFFDSKDQTFAVH